VSNIQVKKRSGAIVPLDVSKWQAQVSKVCAGIADVSQSMIEIKALLLRRTSELASILRNFYNGTLKKSGTR
jgi:hypothetical protein